MVSQANGRISRPTTAGLPAPVQRVVDPCVDFFFEILNFFYFFFLCLVNPTQKGSKNVQDGAYNRRTRGDDGFGGGPGSRARVHRMRGGAGISAPPAGG